MTERTGPSGNWLTRRLRQWWRGGDLLAQVWVETGIVSDRVDRLELTLRPLMSDLEVHVPHGRAKDIFVDLDQAWVASDATFTIVGDHSASISTPPGQWSDAVRFAIDASAHAVERAVIVGISCSQGAVGVALRGSSGRALGPENSVDAGTQTVVVLPVGITNEASTIAVRNASADGPSTCHLRAPAVVEVPQIDLSPEDIQLALRDLPAAHLECARRAWGSSGPAGIPVADLPFGVKAPSGPRPKPDPNQLWSTPRDQIVLKSTYELIERLPAVTADPAYLAFLKKYLFVNVARVTRFLDVLNRRGFSDGTVLEWGSLWGSHAVPLQRLGYAVTAADRYKSWENADSREHGLPQREHTDFLMNEGIQVISTEASGWTRSPDTIAPEVRALDDLGTFDVVFAAGVIECVPHTPRLLLEALRGRLRPGGLLVIDTNNHSKYWNRRLLESGKSLFQAIDEQFACDPPWEGHHRSYIASELVWMLEHVGCTDVEMDLLDYNMHQFDELSTEHLDCLATLLADPSQADFLLASGVAGGSPSDAGRERRVRSGF